MSTIIFEMVYCPLSGVLYIVGFSISVYSSFMIVQPVSKKIQDKIKNIFFNYAIPSVIIGILTFTTVPIFSSEKISKDPP